MLTLNDGRSELWQWDTGRKLTVDTDCSQVHFSNKVFGRSVDVDVVDGVAVIPDILLQTDKDLNVWAFVGTPENGYTKISKTFKVNRRNKPADYVFTPPEQTTLGEILDRIEDLEKRPSGDVSKEDIQDAVSDYFDENPVSVVEKDPTVPDWAKQPQKPTYTAEEIGAAGLISVLSADPTEPKEGQMWILKTTTGKLTTPVIELGDVGENSIAIKLSNASFDGSGAVVSTYNIYVNGELNKTENIAAGGTCVVTGLSAETEYQIAVRGVNGVTLSEASNTLIATTEEADEPVEPKIVYLPGTGIGHADGDVSIGSSSVRAVAVYTVGDKACVNKMESSDIYYPIPVPADAISVTVVCPGLMFGYNGWNLSAENKYSYDVDSGWQASGTTYTFEAGAAAYTNITFKRTDNGEVTPEDVTGITITFGTNSEPEPEPEPDYTPEFVALSGYSAGNHQGNINLNQNSSRTTAVYTAGKKACTSGPDGTYYPIPVPAEATSCTVVCPGFKYGYNGWNLSDANAYSYDVDSGWQNSGVTYTFEAGAAEYATIGFNVLMTEEDIAKITITFA